MVFFQQLSTSLKQKWLEYYQKNRPWLILHMTEQNTVQTPDGGRRPVSYLILGILNALDPELEALMLPFSKLKADADSLVEVLGLNFDPDIAIGVKSGSPLDKSTPISPLDAPNEDALESPSVDQPLMPDTIEDSNDLGTAAAAAITGAAAVAGGVALAAGLDQDSDDLLDDDQGESDLELESDDDLDMGLDSDSEADDDLDLDIDSAADELDMELDSGSEADDDLDMGLDSDSETDDDLDMGLDLDSETDDDLDLGEDSSDFLAEDIPDPFEDTSAKLDESGLDELGDDDVNLFGEDSTDEIGDIDLSDLGDDNQFDDLSSDDLGDLDLGLDGEDLNLDEADLDSLAGDKKSSNDDDLEGLLG
ncbi:MAG: DUF5331 domain-containing protein [Cyanobacteria bacterium P01_H01_bin.35]